VARAPVQATQRLRGPEGVKGFRRLPARLLVGAGREKPKRILERVVIGCLDDLCGSEASRCERPFIRLLDDVRVDELVAVPGDRANEPRLPSVVTQSATETPDRLAQRPIGDHDVAPDGIEDLSPVHGPVPVPDQEEEQVEVARNEREIASPGDEDPPGRR